MTSGISSTNPAFSVEWNGADFPEGWLSFLGWASELRAFIKNAVEREQEWML